MQGKVKGGEKVGILDSRGKSSAETTSRITTRLSPLALLLLPSAWLAICDGDVDLMSSAEDDNRDNICEIVNQSIKSSKFL